MPVLRDERLRRALLFMPGDSMKKIRKGATLGVDSIIMDLEDGVALNQKEAARLTVYEALTDADLDFGQTERLVRINPSGKWQTEDIDITVKGKPDGYVIPKVESAHDIQFVANTLTEYERQLGYRIGNIKLLAIIESALGIVNLKEIAQADPRLIALMFGAEDYTSDIGAIRTPQSEEVLYARSAVVAHAAAYGLQAIDTPYVDLKNMDGLIEDTQKAMQLGYSGKLAIHPNQIDPIIKVFMPSEEEIKAAQQLIEAHNHFQQSGAGVFSYNGKMVDMPMIRAAERVLKRAGLPIPS
ncbi:MAG: hypothetical protein CUN55_10860 [Phototrophicales bacterium]|nr:MAG: hypothetical protein CUN55_10860 [Phototrophicales bacterium]